MSQRKIIEMCQLYKKLMGTIPIYDDKGELQRYNIFHASMLVRHSNDGKMYLYDIIDIKKETSNSLSE